MLESHEVLREAILKYGPKNVAAALGVSLSQTYKWTQPMDNGRSGSANPLDRAAELLRVLDDTSLIQWLCHQAGGFYVADPSGSAEKRELLPATNEIIQEFAEMLGVIAAAGANGRISRTEARQVRLRWEELKTVTEGFVNMCEAGHFDQLREAGHQHFPEELLQT